MIKIDKNSWHFKMWMWSKRKYNSRYKNELLDKLSLCTYFWTIILHTFIVFPVSSIWNTMMITWFYGWGYSRDKTVHYKLKFVLTREYQLFIQLGIVYLFTLWGWALPWWGEAATDFWAIPTGIACIITALFVFACIYVILEELKERIQDVIQKCNLSPKPDTLSFGDVVIGFVKAKKNKVCPKLEVDYRYEIDN
ncbi:MAG: hypothetical protein KAS32_07430 [Candidatus Peribacteraceae bacterium]|nr:hypothetical protein [Candidatus Peribacteraceae bacterium]